MRLRHINPLGQVDLPLIGRQGYPEFDSETGEPVRVEGTGCLEPGEEFDVSPEHARALLPQAANYAPADAEAEAVLAELEAEQAPAPEPPVSDPPVSDPPPADPTSDGTPVETPQGGEQA